MSTHSRKIRFGLWYDFCNPSQWRQSSDRLYRDILDQIAWGEDNGFDDVWLSEHHFIEDGYVLSILPVAAAIAARTKKLGLEHGYRVTCTDTASHFPSRRAQTSV